MVIILPRGTSGSFGVPAERDPKHTAPSIDALDAFALERWEVRLSIMPFFVMAEPEPRPSSITWCLPVGDEIPLGQGFEPPEQDHAVLRRGRCTGAGMYQHDLSGQAQRQLVGINQGVFGSRGEINGDENGLHGGER